MYSTRSLVLICLFFSIAFSAEKTDSLQTEITAAEKLVDLGRDLFYQSVEDKSKLDSAFAVFEQLKKDFPAYEGRAVTYIGALTAIRGKHAFWPYSKFRLVLKGLAIMDEGTQKSPDDIEALFVYGSTCYFMPFLFARSDEAQTAFKRILKLLPQKIQNYNPELMNNVIEFLLQNAELSPAEQEILIKMKEKIILR